MQGTTSEEETLPLNANFTSATEEDKATKYRDALFKYGAEVISEIASKHAKQWEPLSHVVSNTLLFTFENHSRLCFSKTRGNQLRHRFRSTTGNWKRASRYSFRVLWLVQSPVFQSTLLESLPMMDKASVYLTFNDAMQRFFVRLCWSDEIPLEDDEIVIQSLVEYDLRSSDTGSESGLAGVVSTALEQGSV